MSLAEYPPAPADTSSEMEGDVFATHPDLTELDMAHPPTHPLMDTPADTAPAAPRTAETDQADEMDPQMKAFLGLMAIQMSLARSENPEHRKTAEALNRSIAYTVTTQRVIGDYLQQEQEERQMHDILDREEKQRHKEAKKRSGTIVTAGDRS